MTKFQITSKADIERVVLYLKVVNIEKPLEVSVKLYKPNRSLAQNNLYHLWLSELSSETGDTTDGLHEHFKDEYIDTEYTIAFGKSKAKTKTTTNLNTKEFSSFLEKIEHFAIHFLNCPLSHPEDLYFKSLYGAKRH